MEKTYRVAIIGLGRMGSTIDDEGHSELPYSIAASTLACDRLELVAGCDIDQAKREAFSERWKIQSVYDDFRAMVEQEQPDLVAVCTAACAPKPTREAPDSSFRGDSHAELGTALAELNVPMVYMEKAIASSMAAADAVKAAIERSGTVFNTGVLRRFDCRYDQVREAVLDGRIGAPKAAVAYTSTSLLHGHIHSIDTLSWLLGDPAITAVRGELLPRDLEIDGFLATDPQATYQLQFANGVEASSVPGGEFEFEIIGDNGAVRSFNNGAYNNLRLRPQDGARRDAWEESRLPELPQKSAVVSCLEDMVTAYESGQPTRGHIGVTHQVTEACFAVAESHKRGGTWVNLPLQDRDTYIFHI
jgi:predicted dehydrogenase